MATLSLTVPTPPTVDEPQILYVASTIPARPLRVSNTTLFRLALQQFGDPLHWVTLARLNVLLDPWVFGLTTVLIPPVPPTGPASGLFTPVGAPADPPAIVSS